MRITEQHVFRHRQDPFCLHLRTEMGVRRITPWRVDLACHHWRGGQWREVSRDPGFLLLSRGNDVSFHKTLTRFLEPIPEEVRDAASRFKFMQFTALRLMRLCPGGVDLAVDNPALFWLCCGRVGRGAIPPEHVAKLLALPRKHLVAELLGRDCVFTDHLFRKIRLRAFDATEYDRLERMLALERTCRSILHLEIVDPAVVCLAYEDGVRVLGDGLVEDLSWGFNPDKVIEAKKTIKDILAMGEEMGIARVLLNKIRKCRRDFELHYLYIDTMSEFNATVRYANVEYLMATYGDTFPEPPLAENADIEPITTLWQLEEEGKAMQHCALLYVKSIYTGSYALYRVHRPERATLAIQVDQFGDATIIDLALKHNEQPSPATRKTVSDWIRTAKRNPRESRNLP